MQQMNLSPRDAQLRKFNSARMNLLLVVICTLINVIFALTGTDTYFLFSAFIPYFLVLNGMYYCGKMPEDWYEEGKSNFEALDPSFLVVLTVIAAVILGLYLVLWLISKKHMSGGMIAALVFFSLDTLAFLLLGGLSLESILDILFHAWVLYYLIVGVIAAQKLKTMPAEMYDSMGAPAGEPAPGVAESVPEDAETASVGAPEPLTEIEPDSTDGSEDK